MGNSNSGRRGGKGTTQGRNALDIRKLQRDGTLTPGTRHVFAWTRYGQPNGSINISVNTDSVNLIYRHSNTDMHYPVMIEWTACNFGGRRAWWRCPCCNKRVALLYSGKMFACRHCMNLTYESTRMAESSKAYARADKVRVSLGWCAGVANPAGDRPKGMHWKTYGQRLDKLNQHGLAAMQSTQALLAQMKGMLRTVSDRLGG